MFVTEFRSNSIESIGSKTISDYPLKIIRIDLPNGIKCNPDYPVITLKCTTRKREAARHFSLYFVANRCPAALFATHSPLCYNQHRN